MDNGRLLVTPGASTCDEDVTAELLSKLPRAVEALTLSEQQSLTDLRRRKLADLTKTTSYVVNRGPKFTMELEKPFLELTAQMVISGSWKDRPFKPYNFDADGPKRPCGHLHPLLKVRNEFRQIFFEMGYL